MRSDEKTVTTETGKSILECRIVEEILLFREFEKHGIIEELVH